MHASVTAITAFLHICALLIISYLRLCNCMVQQIKPGRSDKGNMEPLLTENHDQNNHIVGMLKAKKWVIIFVCAIVLVVAIIVTFVATKSSSSTNCSFNTNSEDCFFKGTTRLPQDLKPQTYTIRLQPDLNIFLFNGSSQMVVKCLENTKRVVFHQKGLMFDQSKVFIEEQSKRNAKEASNEIQIDDMRFDTEQEQVIIRTKSLLVAGKEYKIIVYFKGKLNEKLEGFYKSSYKTKSGETRYLATTNFEATAARQAFPCFDEPALKANFTIVITHQLQYLALSNMPVESSRILRNNLNETTFMPSVKMSTYLVAFVVCDFKYIENTTAHGIKVRVWTPADVINEATLALKSASVILDYYENYFNIRYPLPKQDLLAIPDFASGAMENWGMITFRLTSLLADPNKSSSQYIQWVVKVVAHELSHQWFGNLVTMQWWDDLWLNEGFATYLENVAADVFEPKLRMMDQFILDNIFKSMKLDELANSHPISVVVKNPSEISSLFDDISYMKGASLIYMLNTFLGANVFREGLHSYLKKHEYGNAATHDLWTAFTKYTSFKVSDVMDTWTLQMGFPLVTITKQKNGVYQAVQEHFLINPDSKPTIKSPYNYKWYIPLSYRTDKDETLQIRWMNMSDATINVDVADDGWLKANYHQTGFYRVNYPTEIWKNIIKTLNTDHERLSAADRAGLIDDAFALARAGKLNYNIALDMTSYLHKEKEYIVWSTAIGCLSYIASRLTFTPYYGLYQVYLLSKVTPVLDKLTYKDKGEHLQKLLRVLLFSEATLYDYKPAMDETGKLFEGFMAKNESVDANFESIIFDYGVRNGGSEEWEFIWSKYNKEVDAETKNRLLIALTQSRRPWLLQRCLKSSQDENVIKSEDAYLAIAGIAGNPDGRLLAWDFFRLNWEELHKRYGSDASMLTSILKAVLNNFQTEFHYNEVKSFFDTHSGAGPASRSLQQSYETIKSNINWVENYKKDVVQWLVDHKPQ